MKERGIIFNTEMVKAILDGRKTVTRRPLNGDPSRLRWEGFVVSGEYGFRDEHGRLYKCPFGQIGDRLYVRETYSMPDYNVTFIPIYKADGLKPHPLQKNAKWNPSYRMPKSAARLWLEVTGVRVERIQDITEEQAIKEGIIQEEFYPDDGYPLSIGYTHEFEKVRVDSYRCLYNTAKEPFSILWDSVYKIWNENPWVWVIEFKRIER